MKTIFTLLVLSLTTIWANAIDVKLKITYNGNGVAGHTVTVMLGDAPIGSGVTDDGGNVTVSVSSLPVKDINLKGEKTCDNAKKSWEAKGYVKLDDNNYAELKMDDLVKEMVEASGGFMSEKMLVGSYGLVCGGTSSSSDNSSSNSTTTGNSTTNNSTSNDNGTVGLMSREESLTQQKTMLENKIENIDRKIEKKNEKIKELEGDKKKDAEFDVRELEIDKKQTQNKLDKVNLQIEKGMLNKEERNRFKDRDDELDEEMKALKAERKNKGEVVSTTSTSSDTLSNAKDDLVFTDADFANMSKSDLGKKKLSLNSELSKLKLKLKTRKNSLSPNEVTETEMRITKLEFAIASIEAEQEKRKTEKE